ncbi:putative gastrointestinal growth factor xP4 [Hyla sarda]|uniref:putative gastrointestinal growth factor xP4 n=1 Tax=Hyla sarda TaxID=327740 RepID=UPI0024C41AAF|nr:putative gastrointestinal growth factor xP4 [Hyla sarda]XP_056379509.1 putative gastrointestinal growth factor xP4 [Hyla sarda]
MSASGFLLLLISAMIGCAAAQESCIISEADMKENNIKLRWGNVKTVPNYGVVEFVCKPGYDHLYYTSMRSLCEIGKLNYPECFSTEEECGGPVEKRRECGYNGVSHDECRSRECCYDASNPKAIKCFYKKSQDEAQCVAKPFSNKPCGAPVANARECYDRGCCFNSTLSRDKWCFAAEELTHECGGSLYLRRDCGFPGITLYECTRRNCCYNSLLSTDKVEWCYHKQTSNNIQCAVRPLDRKACGRTGITAKECFDKGCCFDPSIPGGQWCYSPKELTSCVPTDEEMDENNIVLKVSEDFKITTTYIEFECRFTYKVPPDTDMRLICKNGKKQFPKCFKKE